MDGIQTLAADAKAAGLPLATTECWGITDYKDFPMLPWGWVKDLCALGVETGVSDRTVGADGDEQLRRAAVLRHVAGCCVASASDDDDSRSAPAAGSGKDRAWAHDAVGMKYHFQISRAAV